MSFRTLWDQPLPKCRALHCHRLLANVDHKAVPIRQGPNHQSALPAAWQGPAVIEQVNPQHLANRLDLALAGALGNTEGPVRQDRRKAPSTLPPSRARSSPDWPRRHLSRRPTATGWPAVSAEGCVKERLPRKMRWTTGGPRHSISKCMSRPHCLLSTHGLQCGHAGINDRSHKAR